MGDAETVVRYALGQARRAANNMRLNALNPDGWFAGYEFGSTMGQLMVAQYDMDADPMLVQSARNEIGFLLVAGGYLKRSHA